MIQKLQKSLTLSEIAKSYYEIICAINKIKVTEKELSLLTFCALRGSISSPPIREDYITQHNSSKGTVYNMTASLIKKKLFSKINNKVKVNPSILLDFTKEKDIFILHITLKTLEQ